jgi:uncharacterized protein DUF6178
MALANLDIRRQAELVLRLPAEQRARFLLEAPRPMALVRALPDGDFYLTVREIGPQGALPLLALASASQIAHLLDLESWRQDRFDPLRSGAWVALLVEAGEPTIRRFARTIDDETLILLFRLWAKVTPLDIDHEEPTTGHGIGDIGDERGFLSPDGANLFSPERSEHAVAARRLAEILFVDDPNRYLGIIRSALFELPSEVEETALHWRASRLEEHGYPTWEEALSIYAPPETLPGAPAEPMLPAAADGAALPAPRAPLRVLGQTGLIARGIDAMSSADRERALFGLMALANRVLVADGGDAGSIETHALVMERAGAYVGISLEARGATEGAAAAAVLAEVPVVELFREGYGRAAALQSRARVMLKDGWGRGAARAEELIDAPLRARVRALLLPRPLYVAFAEGEEAVAARDFRTLAEIDETRVTLELCETLRETLLTRRGSSVADILNDERRPLEDTARFSTLLLTALAWHATRGELRVDRLPSDLVADFLRTTASRRTADPAAQERAMSRLVEALELESGLSRLPAATLRAFGTTCLERLAADCATLDPGLPATPRVVGCLRLA